MTIPIDMLRRAQARLRRDIAKGNAEIARIDAQRNAVVAQGVAATGDRLMLAYARQVKGFDQRIALADRGLRVLRLQSELLGQLLFARENRDTLKSGLLSQVNWERVLDGLSTELGARARQIHRLEALMTAIRDAPVPASSGPARLPSAPSEGGSKPIRVGDPGATEVAKTISVPDGDGLNLEGGLRVRYIGIDAPEMSGEGGLPEALAEEARRLNERLVAGQRVRLEKDISEVDRYGRLLRYVWVGSTFVNAEMVKSGLAMAFTVYPDEKHAPLFVRLEEEARHARRGLWASGYV